LIQQTLVTQQDSWAQSRGQIVQGLIQVYRGLGGGWQIQFAPPPDKRGILSLPPAEEFRPQGAPMNPADPTIRPPEELPPVNPDAQPPAVSSRRQWGVEIKPAS
jgi:hypothetical protein